MSKFNLLKLYSDCTRLPRATIIQTSNKKIRQKVTHIRSHAYTPTLTHKWRGPK